LTNIIPKMNNLQLKLRNSKNEKIFYDFLIDGKSLVNLLKVDPDYGKIGLLGSFPSVRCELILLDQYLGVKKCTDFENNRIPLLGCRECGDSDCGAISFELKETENTMIWCNFGEEVILEGVYLEQYKTIGPFEFGKTEYKKVFEEYKNRLVNTLL
jgi:hypothetical protein